MEFAILAWVDRFDTRRLLDPIGKGRARLRETPAEGTRGSGRHVCDAVR